MDDYLVELESCRLEAPSITLETDLTSCPVCLILEPKEINSSTKSKIIVYTRDGTLLAEHKEKRCNNRNCRVGAYYGYIVIRGGDRIYLPNCLNNEFLVESSQDCESFARRTFTTPKIRTFTTPKFGHFPPPKKNICQEDNCHPQFFFFFFWRIFLGLAFERV